MATIYIDNLIKPKSLFSPNNKLTNPTNPNDPVYTDLHLDLGFVKGIGNGLDPHQSNDVVVDHDSNAIKNSLFNIFTTRPGEKILNPSFGAALDQFLFESVSDIKARIIGNQILKTIAQFEPRIEVLNLQIAPLPDQNMYYVMFQYKLLNVGITDTFQINFQQHNVNIV
jgi:hypothetical protein